MDRPLFHLRKRSTIFITARLDVALIGEMRDRETAQSAIEAALTGHLVLSSLHTTHASAVPIRLREMGIEPYLIASSLTGVLAQRLVPRLCQACKYHTAGSDVHYAFGKRFGQYITSRVESKRM